MPNMRQPFDFEQLAENGLRRGFTTGTCATAAVKAALLKLLYNQSPQSVQVNLVDNRYYVTIPIEAVEQTSPEEVQAIVAKDAGDDPDVTHKARIFAKVRHNSHGVIRFFAGEGVGTITQPGFAFPVGEPAINPVPRQMMENAVLEVLSQKDSAFPTGFDLEIGCENGEALAQKTYNKRLGIVGGISILGTTGIVEPKSLSSWLASIELYIRIALAESPNEIVFAPGNLGQRFAMNALELPVKQIVQMANFVGFSLEALERTLGEYDFILPKLWLAGHPGKLAKLLNGNWDTHSKNSPMATDCVCQAATDFGFPSHLIEQCRQSQTVERIIQILESDAKATSFWRSIESHIEGLLQKRVSAVQQIEVRLFKIDGTPLGRQ